MTFHMIINGNIRLIATPESEIETQILTQMMKEPVQVTMHPSYAAGDKQLSNCIVIQPTPPKQG